MTPEEYYSSLKQSFIQAQKSVDTIEKVVRIGDLEMTLVFAGDALIPTFFNAFNHLEVSKQSVGSSHIRLFLWDSSSTSTPPVDYVPWKNEPRHHLGLIESWTNDDIHTLQQPGSEAIYMFSKERNEGVYWVSSVDNIPYWESDFPLRMILHWWLIDSEYQPVHAGAVGDESGGLLLIGKGGSGKSTSTLSCLNSSLQIAGDDYILLDTNENVAFSLFSLSKLTLGSIQLLDKRDLSIDTLPPPIDDKYRIRLYPKFQSSLIKEIPIRAILLPIVTKDQETTIVQSSAAEAMLALAPTTLFQLPGYREESFAKMSQFVRQVPAYQLRLGTKKVDLPIIFEEFIESLAKA